MSGKCKILLRLALEGRDWHERRYAINKLKESGCVEELGIVAKRGRDWHERRYAMERLSEV